MNKTYIYALIYMCMMLCSTGIYADYKIIMFARSLPQVHTSFNLNQPQTLAHSKTIISNILQETLKSHPVSSLCATYAGYVTFSSHDGQIAFPRKQQRESFNLIITPLIKPIMMLGATVHHFELLPHMPASAYTVERKQDRDTGLYYWDVKVMQLPQNRILTLNSIVLFAQPCDIYVPLGITLTDETPQLLLPDIYVRNSFNVTSNALHTLTINHFFEQLRRIYKKGSENSWVWQFAE